MALVIPDRVPPGTPDSERRVYHALSGLPDPWRVFHSVSWQSVRNGRQGDGEADFALLHPTYGRVVIEVKGGGIKLDGGRWFSVDRSGSRHRIKDPFEQATDSEHALVGYLKDCLPNPPWIPAGHGVVFTDVGDFGALGPVAPAAITWGRADLDDPESALHRLVEHWELNGDLSGFVEDISALLSPAIVGRRLLRDEIAETEARLFTLTQEQFKVLDGLRRNRRAIVYGGAGTGKTVLAVEKARRLAADGFGVLLTCFNRPLADHVAAEFETVDSVLVRSFHGLCRWQMGMAAQPFPSDPPSEWWDHTAAVELAEAARITGFSVDAVVVDEGQDFDPEWFAALQMLLREPDLGPMYVFADTHQAIYRDGWEEPFRATRYDLETNCRNTLPIAEKVAAVYDDVVATLGAHGPAPEWIDVVNAEGATASLPGVLHRMVNDGGLRPDQVIILTQRKATTLGLRGSQMAGQLLTQPG